MNFFFVALWLILNTCSSGKYGTYFFTTEKYS